MSPVVTDPVLHQVHLDREDKGSKVSIHSDHGGDQSCVSSRQRSKVQRTEVKVQRLAHIESIVSGTNPVLYKG